MSTYCPKDGVYVDSLRCVGCDYLADSHCTYECDHSVQVTVSIEFTATDRYLLTEGKLEIHWDGYQEPAGCVIVECEGCGAKERYEELRHAADDEQWPAEVRKWLAEQADYYEKVGQRRIASDIYSIMVGK